MLNHDEAEHRDPCVAELPATERWPANADRSSTGLIAMMADMEITIAAQAANIKELTAVMAKMQGIECLLLPSYYLLYSLCFRSRYKGNRDYPMLCSDEARMADRVRSAS